MLQALYNYFYSLYQLYFDYSELNLEDIYLQKDVGFGVGGITITEYFAFISSLIALIIIVVLCCLFVYKIIKLVGGLIR